MPFISGLAERARRARHAMADLDDARDVLGPLDVARKPIEAVGGATQHQSSNTQVSLVPPPWLELTTSEPSRRATRVRPPGTMWISLPDSTKGRRSTWRGATPLSTKVGQVESDSVGCAMYLAGSATIFSRNTVISSFEA